jgi:dihydrofolate reductase
MSQVTCSFTISLDGFGAGPNQSLEQPFGDGIAQGEMLDVWAFDNPENHRAEVDAIVDAGAFIMGRNMFTPGRGEWDLSWKGWWGNEPPYHAPVFVLTHHPREPVVMDGGTTFHFVTDGIEGALAQARAAAGDRNVSICGGATTINEFLAAGLIDELRLHLSPRIAGLQGVRLFDGVGPRMLTPVSARHTPEVTHLVYRR